MWLVEQGDWVELGAADEQKAAKEATVEAWGRSEGNPVGGKEGRAFREHRCGARTSVRVDADPKEPPALCVGDDEFVLAEGDPVRAEREAEPEVPGSEQER